MKGETVKLDIPGFRGVARVRVEIQNSGPGQDLIQMLEPLQGGGLVIIGVHSQGSASYSVAPGTSVDPEIFRDRIRVEATVEDLEGRLHDYTSALKGDEHHA